MHKGREQEKKKGSEKNDKNKKNTLQHSSKYIPINNYSKCKLINAPIKRLVTKWDKKQDPSLSCL